MVREFHHRAGRHPDDPVRGTGSLRMTPPLVLTSWRPLAPATAMVRPELE